jgi:TctA family transporter
MVLGIVLGRSGETNFRQAATVGFHKIASHPIAITAILAGLLMLGVFYFFKDKVQDD